MVAFIVYLFIASIPAIWFEANQGQDMAVGMGIYCLMTLIAALPIYLAYLIAKEV
jgi:hypothetical protein